jgi:hypothetical protein
LETVAVMMEATMAGTMMAVMMAVMMMAPLTTARLAGASVVVVDGLGQLAARPEAHARLRTSGTLSASDEMSSDSRAQHALCKHGAPNCYMNYEEL